MASLSKRVAAALQKEFVEGTVFRVDLDHVDVAPAGSSGILRSLPLTGDREKIQPGNTVKIVTIAGERMVLALDQATDLVEDEGPGDLPEAWRLEIADLIGGPAASSAEETASTTVTAGNTGWVYLTTPKTSTSWDGDAYTTVSYTTINMVSTFGLPAGTKAILVRIAASDTASVTAGTTMHFQLCPKGAAQYGVTARPGGHANNLYDEGFGIVALNSAGECEYSLTSSGTGTMKCYIQVYGYLLGDDTLASGWVRCNALIGPNWSNRLISTSSANNPINVFTEWGVPTTARQVIFRVQARDTGSLAGADWYFALYKDTTTSSIGVVRPCGITNNAWAEAFLTIPINTDGTIYWRANTSGSNSMTINMFLIGYELPVATVVTNANTLEGYSLAASGTNAHVLRTNQYGGVTINENLTLAGSIWSSVPAGCRVYRSTGQAFAHNGLIPLSFDIEVSDTDACWALAEPTRLYARRPGYYMAGGSFELDALVTATWGRTLLAVRKNGTDYIATNENYGASNIYSAVGVQTGMVYLNTGDYLEMIAYQTHGAARSTRAANTANQHFCYAWLTRIN